MLLRQALLFSNTVVHLWCSSPLRRGTDMKKGYENMSPRGRALCEFVELTTRLEVQKSRQNLVPFSLPLAELEAELQKRYLELSENEKAAVIDLRGFPQPCALKRPRWVQWLKEHLQNNPGDAPDLVLLEHKFADSGARAVPKYLLEKFGVRDFPWKMCHPW